MERSEQINIIKSVVSKLQSENDEWVDLAKIGLPLTSAGINFKQLGYEKLRLFLETFSDILEIDEKKDGDKLCVFYARLKQTSSIKPTKRIAPTNSTNQSTPPIQTKSTKRNALFEWAYLGGDYKEILKSLAEMSLEENWYYGVNPPANNIFPILDNYLRYTFTRLRAERKVLECDDIATKKTYSAFNTGLVDKKYDDIFALFEKSRNAKLKWRLWRLLGFVVAGEEFNGKLLVRVFNPLPNRATYFDKLEHMLYDPSTGELSCDIPHILKDRIARFPITFLLDNCPKDFLVINGIDLESISSEEKNVRDEYYRNLGNNISETPRILKVLRNRLEDSIGMAIKRVEWNYKTAIPTYYPPRDTGSLLLPLSLTDDEKVDLALVVERNPSGTYQGHTVITLEMAYNNSRLITRPDSDWLNTNALSIAIDTDVSEENDP